MSYSVYLICKEEDFESKKELLSDPLIKDFHRISPQYLNNNGTVLKDLHTRYNTKSENIISKLGCIAAHRLALLSIYNQKSTNNIILEADAVLKEPLPDPPSLSCYMGGWMVPLSFSSKEPIQVNPNLGMNQINPELFRIIMAHSYFIKYPAQAMEIFQSTIIPKIKNYDIHLANQTYLKHYLYPPLFTQGKHISEIDKKINKNDQYTEMYGLQTI
tara:strand:+ start:3392 stop:4039 length:648 start_codon:yes stop_codon:yes gene_type:complete